VVERIAASALPDVPDPEEKLGILEIGPGIGVLTQKLSAVAHKVTAVEIDTTLLPILEKTLADCPNVHVVNNDIMKVDLPALIAEEFADCTRLAVCANLPYYITTPILMALLESKLPFSSITVMVQKEVAERLCAPAGSDAYGAITAVLTYYGLPKRLFTVSAGNFVPAPKVDSAVVQIKLHKAPPVKVESEDKLFAVIKAAFGQRRKTLQNALSSLPGVSKEQIASAIAEAGFAPTVRGEALDLAAFAKIANLL
jgi:16S rRNA (adenine1518-N6/adenine1519-N6)-dimethyltransferase